ncbi:histidine kinase-like ATPase [Rhizophagus clarus]|uniref:Histidine kinase-like ATPase n=1 Tax=Rhizophagus clarus TaxID=94130 RepID=A0A8H3QV32_9GLOM|nr:histidine kinase-like ATPase [Rhizophagus clarus]
MTNLNNNSRAPPRGEEFKPREPYTHRLSKLLEEYPDGTQVLREILQNSDDAKSTFQTFILDHNTYQSKKLLEPHLNGYKYLNLNVGKYQGPALLAINGTIFEENDFVSLLSLADSKKQNQFDKIGVMGVGFNSIYHITDSPSFITGDKYVILDPHEWYYNGGVKFDFVEENLFVEYPDQFAPFAPFGIPCNERFEGTIFRHPLRNSTDSKISKKIYKTDEILKMFHKFYKNESINCLLFLKYIECISFYELKKGASKPELLYRIQLDNAIQVRERRCSIARSVVPKLDLLISRELNDNTQLESSYVASFRHQEGEGSDGEVREWLILNYLDDLLDTEAHFQKRFKKNIGDHKFIPNVGLAVPLDSLNVSNAPGRLFCFLPLPIDLPFLVSVHGYFAVSNNRRSLWSAAGNEDLAIDGLAYLKIQWNEYLFEKVLPKAWIRFLLELPKVADIQLDDIYSFWPRIRNTSDSMYPFCKDLIKNIVENLDIEDRMFNGPASNATGYHWLSLSDGYLDEKLLDNNLLKIIGSIGFPIISVSHDINFILQKSRHNDSLKRLSPAVIRQYLDSKFNRTRWELGAIPRQDVLQLFKYILSDKNFNDLEGFKMIPLADDTLGTLTLSSDTYVYIDEIVDYRNDHINSLINQLNSNKLIDKTIDFELYQILYNNAKARWGGCNLNIRILDEIEVRDLILIIRDMNENKELTINKIENVIGILKRIAKIQNDAKLDENNLEILDELLVPNTNNILVELQKIYYDDMGDNLDDEEKSKYEIAHNLVTRNIAEGLGIQTLKGKIFGNEDSDWETYEQHESLTTRIKNILDDYSIDSLFKEFLQNADDAGATQFSVFVDERAPQHYSQNLFSDEMICWQGPAIWIYNNAMFTDDDFRSLLKLGTGGKSNDDKKIGRFGIGFNCSFHVTDLPSFVSGKYIAFLDPHAKFLPEQGFPPKRPKGVRINFMEKNFKSFYDQCHPYKKFSCNFSSEFEGTLFRLPLRTFGSGEQSEISNKIYEAREILRLFNNIQHKNEMLFLRNIESCNLFRMNETDTKLIWQAKINNIDSCRDFRQNVVDEVQIYQLDIEKTNIENEKISEIWLLCSGGHKFIFNRDLREFSNENRLKPRGGIASLLAKSYEKSLDELRSEPVLNPPNLEGELYSYLSLSINTNLGVHLNGNFFLPSARNGILQSKTDFLQGDCVDAKWNRHILYDVLPELHVKLLNHIVDCHENQEANFLPYISNNLWPITKNSTINLYEDYYLNVIKKLGVGNHRVFWTELNSGQFISLEEAKIFGEKQAVIANILISSGIPAVKLDRDKIEQLNKIIESRDPPNFPYKPVSGESVCEDLQMVISSIPSFERGNKKYNRGSLFELLNFILQDKNSFGTLTDLPLVPLSNGSVGKFGVVYYIGKQKHLELFPNIGPSKFVSIDLPKKLQKIFNDDNFCACTNIKKFDASGILDLLKSVLQPVRELRWEPNGNSLPNKSWLEKVWAILNKDTQNVDFNKLSKFPLLPVVQPYDMLIRPDINNPLIYIPENGHTLFPLYPALTRLTVRITNMVIPEDAHKDLKKCIVKCDPVNIINSLENTRLSSSLTMKQLFEIGELSPAEHKLFRELIRQGMEAFIAAQKTSQKNFMDIVRSLPIWETNLCDGEYSDATSGILLPFGFPFYSFRQNSNVYKPTKKDHASLTKLGTTCKNGSELLKDLVQQINTLFPNPSQHPKYTTFLKKILSDKWRNDQIEQFLKIYPMFPNKTLTEFVKINTLYNMNVPIFRRIFKDDKFLPSELQDSPECLKALEKMGLICELIPTEIPETNENQREILLNTLLKKLTEQQNNEYHDVIFNVGKKKIGANRYILSAASEHFEREFHGLSEKNVIEINVPDDIQPICIEILLRWLYGQPFDVAKTTAINEMPDANDHIPFFMDVLKVAHIYKVEELKSIIETTVKKGQYINVHEVYLILKCSRECNAQGLTYFYEKHIKSNKEIFREQLNQRENAANEGMLQMINSILDDKNET